MIPFLIYITLSSLVGCSWYHTTDYDEKKGDFPKFVAAVIIGGIWFVSLPAMVCNFLVKKAIDKFRKV